MRSLARWLGCALGVSLLAAPARAMMPGVREVIERYVKASGGRAALDADTPLHVAGHMSESGADGTFEEWRRSPDALLRIEKLGALRTKEGFDGGRAWRTDFTSRKVGPLEGKDLEAIRAEAWFATEQWARDTTAHITLGMSA